MKKNRKIKIIAMLAMALAVVMSFAACGGGIGGFFSGLFSKNYWNATKSRTGYENTIKVSGKTITLTLDGEWNEDTEIIEDLYLTNAVEVEFPADTGLKLDAEVEKSTLPAGVTLSLRVGYLHNLNGLIAYKDVKLISNSKNYLPVSFYPPVKDYQIVSYCFYAGDIDYENVGAYIQFKNIKITSIKA